MTTNQQHRSDQIAALYAQHAHRLRWLVASKAGGPAHMADDACAEAWELLLTRTHVDLAPPHWRALAWLTTTAMHAAWRLRADRQVPSGGFTAADGPRAGTIPEPADLSADTADLGAERMTNDQRRVHLAALKPAQQRALVLHAAGYTYDEIADLTASTRTAVNRRITEGRAALRMAARHHVHAPRALPTQQRDLALAQAGYTTDQIADATNTTTAAVNRRLRAARAALRTPDPDA